MSTGLFDGVVGQPLAVAILSSVLRKGVGHAYMFVGPRGVGKTEAALAFAAALLCPERGCGCCEACRRARAGVHPDLVTIAPDGNFIHIGAIREINADAAKRPYQAAVRVYLILDADAMNAAAANAFLKTLEEPPGHVRFILVTNNPERLPQTIVSRCQRVPFSRIPVEPLAAHLRDLFGLSEDDCRALARVSQGDLRYAREFVESKSMQDARVRVLSQACALPGADFARETAMVDEMMDVLEERQAQAVAAVEASRERELEWAGDARTRAWVEKTLNQRSKREKRAAMLAGVDEVIRGFAGWYRDLAVVAAGAEEVVHNVDYLDDLRLNAMPGLLSAYLAVVSVAERTRERFRYNVDARCALEDMVFSMKEALL